MLNVYHIAPVYSPPTLQPTHIYSDILVLEIAMYVIVFRRSFYS